jgi:hypothetical protein
MHNAAKYSIRNKGGWEEVILYFYLEYGIPYSSRTWKIAGDPLFRLGYRYLSAVLGTVLVGNHFGLDCGLLGFIEFSTPEPFSKGKL